MSLVLAGSLIRIEDLTLITRHTLSFVDGGLQWVNWAISNSMKRYSFADETDLVGSVQFGLHGTGLAYLPRSKVFVSPIKLMTIGNEELIALSQWEANKDVGLDADQIEGIFEAHHVIPSSNFGATDSLLQRLELAGSPLFTSLTLMERIALWQWSLNVDLSDETTERLAKEAAFFASEQSRQVHDFIDYFYIYINLAQKETSRANQSTEKRMSDVESILQTILAELFDFLDCPQVKSLPAPEHVMKAVMDWLSSGKMLGFSRLSSGARQIIVTPEFQSEPVDIPRAVRDYVMDANQFFSRKHNLIPIMTQDGSTCCYYANDAGKKGQLLLNPEKVISLYSYQSVSSPPETLA